MKNYLTVWFLLCLIQYSFAQPGTIYYITNNGIDSPCLSPGCSGANPIPFHFNSCLNKDTISTSERWFILMPDSTSISIKITLNSQCHENINDVVIYNGVYPKLFLIPHPSISIAGGLVEINSL